MKTKLIGYIGVDSGQVMIGDPCYLDEFKTNGYQPNREAQPHEFSYQAAAEASLSGGGMIGNFRGAVSMTMYGDGLYPVYQVLDGAGEVTGLFVDFDYTPEDDE